LICGIAAASLERRLKLFSSVLLVVNYSVFLEMKRGIKMRYFILFVEPSSLVEKSHFELKRKTRWKLFFFSLAPNSWIKMQLVICKQALACRGKNGAVTRRRSSTLLSLGGLPLLRGGGNNDSRIVLLSIWAIKAAVEVAPLPLLPILMRHCCIISFLYISRQEAKKLFSLTHSLARERARERANPSFFTWCWCAVMAVIDYSCLLCFRQQTD